MEGRRVKQTWVSKSKATSIGNGPSHNPTIIGAGEFVLFDSLATNLKRSLSIRDDANGVRDVFLWNRPSGNVSLESRAARGAGRKGDYLQRPVAGPGDLVARQLRGVRQPGDGHRPAARRPPSRRCRRRTVRPGLRALPRRAK